MNTSEELLTFIKKSPSAFHAVEASKELLRKAGFEQLIWGKSWKLKAGGRYFCSVYDSTLVAFTTGKKAKGLKIAMAHTDSPGFRVKPAAGIVREGYGILNVEPYGGLIERSWLDRPLSLAGKIILRGKDAFSPKVRLVDFARPLMTIPSLAIHMNRQVNDGVKLNRQNELTPLTAVFEREFNDKDFFEKSIAKEFKIKGKDILSYDLTIYPYEEGCIIGQADELISSPRLDNLTSVKACIDAIIAAEQEKSINIVSLFDNEEVGSRTKQGAGSAMLEQLLEGIYHSLGKTEDDLRTDIAEGFMLSVDGAHGLHPNYMSKADPTNQPVLNGGVVLKQAANQAYVGDAEATAIVKALCLDNNIPFQTFVNRSDVPGGSTLGSIASAVISMRGMDIGVPMLAMHSARELMGAKDQTAITNLVKVFFE